MTADTTADFTSAPKYLDIKEFREQGFLQEANRLFFHPLGLALEVVIDDASGEECLGGVWDYRDDPEGVLYAAAVLKSGQALQKASRVFSLGYAKRPARQAAGCGMDGIQELT